MSIAAVLSSVIVSPLKGAVVEESLIRLEPVKHCSWIPHGKTVEFGQNSLKIIAGNNEKKIPLRGGYSFPAYVAAERFCVTCRYRSSTSASFLVQVSGMEKPKFDTWQSAKLEPSEEWKEFSHEFKSFHQDLYEGGFYVVVPAGKGEIEIRDFMLVECEPDRKDGRHLIVEGADVNEIVVAASGTPMERRSELRAARMLRYALYMNGGKYLPIRSSSVNENGKGAVLIGRIAATGNDKPATGGYLLKTASGKAALYGDAPCGNELGVWCLLRKIGIEYLGSDRWYPVTGEQFELAHVDENIKPSVPYHWVPYRAGIMCELIGQDNQFGAFADLGCGSRVHQSGLLWDSLGRIVLPDEFKTSHPEFFAARKDGSRTVDRPAALAQFCWSNKELQKLVGERYCEMMECHPEAKFFTLAPGDGGEDYCRCAECAKMGSRSDRMVKFANAVAEITSEKYPDKYIFFYPYADTQEPPDPSLKAHPNVKIALTIYITSHWPSQLMFDHPANRRGLESLAGWRKVYPDAGYIGYYDNCNEWLRWWPNFDFTVELTKDFAAHGAFIAPRFGLITTHANGVLPQSGGFTHLRTYVISRLELDASADPVALAKHYCEGMYGPAAPEMIELNDITRRQPRERELILHTESRTTKIMTKDFAAKGLALLDAAEKKAVGDNGLRRAILDEKMLFLWSYLNDICRGRGNLSEEEFRPWAARLAEFCRIAKECGNAYWSENPSPWFKTVAFYKVGHKHGIRWWEEQEIEELIKDPVATLGEGFPNLQTKIEGGYAISSEGMMGGEFFRQSKWMSKTPVDMRILRRISSEMGTVMTKLKLDAAPTNDVKFVITGVMTEKTWDVPDMEIIVNETVVFKGKASFPRDHHTEVEYIVPAKTLKTGSNDIVLRNPTPDNEAKFDGEGGANFRVARDYNYGWFAVDGFRFIIK